MTCVARQAELTAWVDGWKPSSPHGALPHLGVHRAVAVLYEALRSGQAIVSQDFSEAFDRASPELSINALRKTSISPELATALEWVWAHQVRCLAPGSPLLCCNKCSKILQNRGHDCTIVTYVDDRTTAVRSVEAAFSLVEGWRREAPRFGMKENETKRCVVPRGGAAKRRQFKNQRMDVVDCPESSVVGTRRILGVHVGGAALSDIIIVTGTARLEDAERRARRVAALSQWRECMKTFLATSVSAVASLGWWLREPLRKNSNNSPRSCESACRVQVREHRDSAGTWLNRVHRWLSKLSWREVSPWRWRQDLGTFSGTVAGRERTCTTMPSENHGDSNASVIFWLSMEEIRRKCLCRPVRLR